MKKKTILVIVLCVVFLLMASAYAIFRAELHISSSGNITTNWNIYFSELTSTATGRALNIITPTVTNTTISFEVELMLPGDKMEYDVILKNGGDVNALVNDIVITSTGPSQIINSITGIQKGDELAADDEIPFKIAVQFDPNSTAFPTNNVSKINCTIDVIQNT